MNKALLLSLSLLTAHSLSAMDTQNTQPLTPQDSLKSVHKKYGKKSIESKQRKNRLWKAFGLTIEDMKNPKIKHFWRMTKALNRLHNDQVIPYGYFAGKNKTEKKAARALFLATLKKPLNEFGTRSESSETSSSGTSSGTSSDSSSDFISE